MATEYGYRFGGYGAISWWGYDRLPVEEVVKRFPGAELVAREVSEPRIVSIRA